MMAVARLTPTPRAESIRRLRTLVSPYTGVIRRVEEVLAGPDEIPLVAISCETGDGALLPSGPVSRLGSGSGPDRESALAAALGEAVERYSAACPGSPDDLVVGCAAELGAVAVRPGRFALFSREQHDDDRFPYRPFTETTRVAWARGFALPDGEPALVPAQLVYLGDVHGAEEVRIGPSTSNGLACHATLEEAVLSGLLEVVERDAFMIVWSNRLSLPRLSWERDEELLAFEARYLEPTGLRCAAIDLSGFWGVPTALGVVRSEEPGTGALGVGACSAPLVQEAVWKALDEACRVQAWATDLLFRHPEREFAPDFSDVQDFDDHVHYYADRARSTAADFLDGCREIRDVGDVQPLAGETVPALIEAISRRLHARGSSAYAVDVTAPDIRAAGLSVAKVVAPELCALDADHRARFLGGRRMYEAAFELGLSSRVLAFAELNPYPHPFP
jgi:ribosomal protein S12 methylthiotransferase accessory factor